MKWGRVIKPSGEYYSFLKSAELTNRIVWSNLVAIPKLGSQILKVSRGRVGVRKRARIAGERVGGWEGSWLWFCWILIRWSNNRLETEDGKFQSCDCNWTSMLDWAQQGEKRHYSVKNIKDYFQRGKTVVSRDWGYFGLIFFSLLLASFQCWRLFRWVVLQIYKGKASLSLAKRFWHRHTEVITAGAVVSVWSC